MEKTKKQPAKVNWYDTPEMTREELLKFGAELEFACWNGIPCISIGKPTDGKLTIKLKTK